MVMNNTRVIKARLHNQKPTGGRIKILLLREVDNGWPALLGQTKGSA